MEQAKKVAVRRSFGLSVLASRSHLFLALLMTTPPKCIYYLRSFSRRNDECCKVVGGSMETDRQTDNRYQRFPTFSDRAPILLEVFHSHIFVPNFSSRGSRLGYP